MRVSKEKAAENRERILKAAAQLIRERGISGAGVDALTEAAGMTHGSLYSQFGSKERLVEEALEYALVASGKAASGAGTLDQACRWLPVTRSPGSAWAKAVRSRRWLARCRARVLA